MIGYVRGEPCLEGSKQFSQSPDATEINISVGKVRPVALVLTLPLTFISHEWPRQDFSLQYQYNINQTSCDNICFGYFFDWANQKIHYYLYSNRLKFPNFREFHVIQSNKEKGEEGRAQALRDLMATKYQPGDSSTHSVRFSELCSIEHSFHSY